MTQAFRSIPFTSTFSPMDLQLLINIRYNDVPRNLYVKPKYKWAHNIHKIYNESDIKEMCIEEDIKHLDKCNVIDEFKQRCLSSTHPSVLSKYIYYYIWWYNKFAEDVRNNEDLYDIHYRYPADDTEEHKQYYKERRDLYIHLAGHQYQLKKIPNNPTEKLLEDSITMTWFIHKLNGIDPQLTGSIVENVISYVFKCEEAALNSKDRDSLNIKCGKSMLHSFCISNFKNGTAKDAYNNINEFLYDTDKDHYKSVAHYILWMSFMHYVERDEYKEHISKCLQILDLITGDDKDNFKEYMSQVKHCIPLRTIIKDECMLHNLKLPCHTINDALTYGGEVDFVSPLSVIDIKVYKNVTDDNLSTWFQQLVLYARNCNMDKSNYNIKYLYIYEGYDNILYTFNISPTTLDDPLVIPNVTSNSMHKDIDYDQLPDIV